MKYYVCFALFLTAALAAAKSLNKRCQQVMNKIPDEFSTEVQATYRLTPQLLQGGTTYEYTQSIRQSNNNMEEKALLETFQG